MKKIIFIIVFQGDNKHTYVVVWIVWNSTGVSLLKMR